MVEWKAVPGWEGAAEVSRCGKVRLLERHAKNGTGWRRVPGGEANLRSLPTGYQYVVLSGNSKKSKNCYVHRLVVEAFIGQIPPEKQVNHLDGDKSNNHVDNLEIVTPLENTRHALDNGLTPVGEDSPKAKMSNAQVQTARRRVHGGESVSDLAREAGVSIQTMHDAVHGRTWSRLPGALNSIGEAGKQSRARLVRHMHSLGCDRGYIAEWVGLSRGNVNKIIRGAIFPEQLVAW